MMVRNSTISGGISFCMVLSGTVAADSIVGSGHDLSNNTPVCIYCHTPHNAGTPLTVPLWNRENSIASYTMYSGNTVDMTIQAAPEGNSLACLSCHDGTIALDALINPPPGFIPGGDTLGGSRNLTPDLSDDHPISIVYDSTQDSGFATTATVAAALPLFDGTGVNQVECATCHDVHDPANKPFLRIPNDGSALCEICHLK